MGHTPRLNFEKYPLPTPGPPTQLQLLNAVFRSGGGTPYNGLYGEAPPERDTFFRLQVYERIGVSRAEVYKKGRETCQTVNGLNPGVIS